MAQINRNNNSRVASSRFGFKCKVVVSVFLSLSLLLVLVTYRSSSPRRRVSAILRELVDFSEHQQLVQQQIDALLEEDPFVEVVKLTLQPVQNKLTSVNTQVGMYEKMERIPGGPQNFIETCLKDLDKIQNEDMTALSVLAGNIMAEKSKQAQDSKKDVQLLLVKYTTGVDLESLEMLIVEGLLEGADPNVSLDSVGKSQTDVFSMIKELAGDYEVLENIDDAILELQAQFGVSEENTLDDWAELNPEIQETFFDMVEEYRMKKRKIKQKVEVNGMYYSLLVPFRHQATQHMMASVVKLASYETDKRGPYIILIQLLKVNLVQTRARIMKLKYGTARKAEL